MLFNSVEFIFRFLPATLAGFWILLRLGNRPAALWLLACSLFFYGWWSPRHVVLLLLSIAFNYGIGLALVGAAGAPRRRRLLLVAGALTFLAVVVAWAPFRAASLAQAHGVLAGMAGLHGAGLGTLPEGLPLPLAWLWIAGLLALVWLAPNTQEIMARHLPQMREAAAAGRGLLLWRPTPSHAALLGLAAVVALGHLAHVSEFLYFQF